MKSYLNLSSEVQRAKIKEQPIVALESTIISHGMPYPQNVETAIEVQNIIRRAGAVPATIALVNGQIKIGFTDEELYEFGNTENIVKASRRDLSYILASKKTGATTVATTMLAAKLANIDVFVTGGIGGVHRGAETTMDISADLEELAQTNVTVVCAGPKAILDIGRTLEYLETKGVPVIGYQTDRVPAFYTRETEFSVDLRADKGEEVAKTIQIQKDLHLKNGLLVVNPIPKDEELSRDEMEKVIETALNKAKELNIVGKDVTPFLLKYVTDLTSGNSLKANMALIKNNAILGAEIAVELNRLNKKGLPA